MKPPIGYFQTNGKISKVNDAGLRTNVYPSGIVTTQLPGDSHRNYRAGLDNNFSKTTPNQMSNYTFNLLKK